MEGSTIGRYRLLEPLGRGAMGSVWAAEDTATGAKVAVKLLLAELAKSRDARARFQREARIVTELSTEHVVRVFDYGVTMDDEPYIAMERLSGESVRERLNRLTRLGSSDIAGLLHDIALALMEAHEKGLVHRDIKPENVFFASCEGREVVKVLDFGVAKVSDALGHGSVAPTMTGTPMGTPLYMSPEQAEGLKGVDFRADLWALGVLAFECMTGCRPFSAETPGALFKQIVLDPIPLPSKVAPSVGISVDIDNWMMRALEREPIARFPSAAELARTFATAAGTSARHST